MTTATMTTGSAGLSESAGSASAEWPTWALFLGILVVLAAVLCAAHWILTAARQGLRTFHRNAIYSHSLDPHRSVIRRRPTWLVLAVAAVSSFFATRWVQAHESPPAHSVPSQTLETDVAPVPEPVASHRPTPATFVRSILPALRRQRLTPTQAVLFAAHLARETGWGRQVHGNNFGNIKTGNWSGSSFELTDRLGFRGAYRAYDTTEAGIRDAVALIRDSARYRRAWRLLERGDTRWYSQLGIDGYYESASPKPGKHGVHDVATVTRVQHEYEQIVNLIRHYDATKSLATVAAQP